MCVRARNGLSRYSINNQLLIALARPDATYVCGFRAWLQLGYQVRKGEKAIWILAPMPIKRRGDADQADDDRTATARACSSGPSRFSTAARSTRSPAHPDTARAAVRAAHRRHPCSICSTRSTRSPRHSGSVSFETIDGPYRRLVRLRRQADRRRRRRSPSNAQVRILVHELAHALGVGYHEYGRAQAEVIVDTVT